MAITGQRADTFRILVVSAIALSIILFPRVHDTGFLHVDAWWVLFPVSILAGLAFLIKFLVDFNKGRIGVMDRRILLGYAAVTAVYAGLIYFSIPSGWSIREAVILNYGFEPDEIFPLSVPIYFLEDLAHVVCGAGFLFLQWKYSLKQNADTYKRSLQTFTIFLAIILSAHFYNVKQDRLVRAAEQPQFEY